MVAYDEHKRERANAISVYEHFKAKVEKWKKSGEVLTENQKIIVEGYEELKPSGYESPESVKQEQK